MIVFCRFLIFFNFLLGGLFVCLFVFFLNESVHTHSLACKQGKGRGTAGERDSQAGSMPSTEPNAGLDLTTAEIITRTKTKSQTPSPLSPTQASLACS